MKAKPRELRFVPWPLEDLTPRKRSIDPETGIAPMSEWGYDCGRGFVSDARFGANSKVIKRTNRDTTRKWRDVSSRP